MHLPGSGFIQKSIVKASCGHNVSLWGMTTPSVTRLSESTSDPPATIEFVADICDFSACNLAAVVGE